MIVPNTPRLARDPLDRIRTAYRLLKLESDADRAPFIAMGQSLTVPAKPESPTFIRMSPNSSAPEEPPNAGLE